MEYGSRGRKYNEKWEKVDWELRETKRSERVDEKVEWEGRVKERESRERT